MSTRRLVDRVRGACAADPGRAVELLAELTALDAPSADVGLLDKTARLLESRLEDLGASIRRIPTASGTHIEAQIGSGARSPLMILAHYDTVWSEGHAAARPFTLSGDTASGPGVFDMRAGIAASLTALAILTELDELHRPVVVLLTADEEIGSKTSEDEILRVGADVEYALVPEPAMPGGGIKTRRKGVITYRLDIGGRASHAGLDPERGVSAIHELACLVQDLDAVGKPAAGTTVNVGTVHGGSRSNVVADSATMEVDIRVATSAEYARVRREVASLGVRHPEATLRTHLLHARPPMERTASIAQAVDRAGEIFSLAGAELSEGSAGGASDGNFLAAIGCGVLDGLGPDGGGAHALDEHVRLASLEERVVVIALLVALL